MPASAPQAITLVAKPVAAAPACIAQVAVCAVTMSRVARIGKASAKLSSMPTPLTTSGAGVWTWASLMRRPPEA